MKKLYRLPFTFLAFIIFSASLSAQTTDGVFVLNEGSFGVENSGISFIASGQLYNDVYADANVNAPLGNTAQSMGFYQDKAFVVLNGSNAVKVLKRMTLELQAVIPVGLSNPRHIAFANDKAYVSCWGDGGNATDDYIAVIDLQSLNVETTIPAAEGVERLLVAGQKLYVAHQGGYGYGNSVSVIDLTTNAVIASLPMGDVPNSMVESGDFLYVLCGGKPEWSQAETFGQLRKVNLADDTVSIVMDFVEKHPSNLKSYGDYLFLSIDSDIYKMTLGDTQLPENPLIELADVGTYGVYGMEIIGDKLYVADAVDYISPGKAYVFSVDGALESDFTVGMLPNGFYQGDLLLATQNQDAAVAVAVYPNPTAEKFFINTNEAAQVKLFDVAGRLVKSTVYNPSGVIVSDLNRGIYLVEITIGNQKSTKRLSIK